MKKSELKSIIKEMIVEEGIFKKILSPIIKRKIPTDFLYDGLFDIYPVEYWEDKMGVSVSDGGVDEIMDEIEYEVAGDGDKKFNRRSREAAVAYAKETFPEYVAYVTDAMLKNPNNTDDF